MGDSWQPARRTVERRNGLTGTIRTVVEVQCRPCRGRGARPVPGPNGTLLPQRVGQIDKRGRRSWLRKLEYEDGGFAPCDGCGGEGWIEMRNAKPDAPNTGSAAVHALCWIAAAALVAGVIFATCGFTGVGLSLAFLVCCFLAGFAIADDEKDRVAVGRRR